jgi:hypothetical protein
VNVWLLKRLRETDALWDVEYHQRVSKRLNGPGIRRYAFSKCRIRHQPLSSVSLILEARFSRLFRVSSPPP